MATLQKYTQFNRILKYEDYGKPDAVIIGSQGAGAIYNTSEEKDYSTFRFKNDKELKESDQKQHNTYEQIHEYSVQKAKNKRMIDKEKTEKLLSKLKQEDSIFYKKLINSDLVAGTHYSLKIKEGKIVVVFKSSDVHLDEGTVFENTIETFFESMYPNTAFTQSEIKVMYDWKSTTRRYQQSYWVAQELKKFLNKKDSIIKEYGENYFNIQVQKYTQRIMQYYYTNTKPLFDLLKNESSYIKGNIELVRGISNWRYDCKIEVGTEFSLGSFSSVAYDPEVAETFAEMEDNDTQPYILSITNPNSKVLNGIPILSDPIRSEVADEREFILSPNTQLEITRVHDKNEDGRIVIDCIVK